MPWEFGMEPLISDASTDSQLSGLEQFLQRYLGPRKPAYGVSDAELRSIQMPAPLFRFFKFAGRWPARSPDAQLLNRFSNQVPHLLGGFLWK